MGEGGAEVQGRQPRGGSDAGADFAEQVCRVNFRPPSGSGGPALQTPGRADEARRSRASAASTENFTVHLHKNNFCGTKCFIN